MNPSLQRTCVILVPQPQRDTPMSVGTSPASAPKQYPRILSAVACLTLAVMLCVPQSAHSADRSRRKNTPQRTLQPQAPAFLPSAHGFKFVNHFPGYAPPFDGAKLGSLPGVPDYYGLCGGMCFSAADYFTAGKAIPSTTSPPLKNSPLYDSLFERQVDSFGVAGLTVSTFLAWMALPDDTLIGTQASTFDEIEEVLARLKKGKLAVLGLVIASTPQGGMVWENHQVLAYGTEKVSPSVLKLRIYDPNYPGRDDCYIRCEKFVIEDFFDDTDAYRCTEFLGNNQVRRIRGIFKIDYSPKKAL